ncbi:MAG: hypothetical protein QG640_48 [Patescibacteria group bacterium]|nr:hypothetical protein [Patescibacteria group bacterium]
MTNIIKLSLLSIIVFSTFLFFEIRQIKASNPICPPQFHCAILADVVAGQANCPDGYDCTPLFPPPPDCPPLDVCFFKTKKSSAATTASTTKGAFSSTAIFISSLDRYVGSPGTLVTAFGKNFPKTATVSITSNSSLPISTQPNSIASSTDGYDMATFYLPQSLSGGVYSISIKGITGLVSNSVSFTVTSLTSSGQTSTGNTNTNTNTNTNANTNTNTNTNTSNTNTNTRPTNTNTNTNTNANTNTNTNYTNQNNSNSTSGKFSINESIQTTDNLRVRSTASIYGTLLTTQPRGTRGKVRGGPTIADGYTWWNIDYASGNDGWSAETYLTKDVTGGDPGQCYTFANDMTLGSSISDIFYLQTAFRAEGFQILDAERSPNPYFGNSTLNAAIGYQGKYGITPQAGYVGPKTRAQLNTTYGCR